MVHHALPLLVSLLKGGRAGEEDSCVSDATGALTGRLSVVRPLSSLQAADPIRNPVIKHGVSVCVL